MITFLVYLLLHIIRAVATTETQEILLSCGSNSTLKSSDGRSWDGDVGTELSPDINAPNISFPASPVGQDGSINSTVPYLTARIIHSRLSYIFPLSSGQKIIRLYFYPTTYSTTAQSFNKTQSLFTVTANQYTLLSNFNAFLAISSLKPKAAYFVKEFIVDVQQNQALNVTFSPMPSSYAFINGIDVVPIPGNVYMGNIYVSNCLKESDVARETFKIDQNKTTLEAVYRINVGGGTVEGKDDTPMFREWLQDDNFLAYISGGSLKNNTLSPAYTLQTPNYSAPTIVYQTARVGAPAGWMANQTVLVDLAALAWKFEVDSGFYYLLRLHFCEFMPHLVYSSGQRVFAIIINEEPVELEADIIKRTGGTGIPIFKDYVTSRQEYSEFRLSLTLRPYNDHAYREMGRPYDKVYGPILNGLEIFKLTRTDAVVWSSECSVWHWQNRSEKKVNRGKIWVATAAGIVVGLWLILFIAGRRRRGNNDSDTTPSGSSSTGTMMSSLPVPLSDLGRRFLLEEIKAATSNFDPAMVIGTGGFGNVYKGCFDQNLAVAIKRSDPCSSQGAYEFRTEIEMLSNLRHLHLVSLIGYCDDDNEMILIYNYMPNGTLRDHLYRTEKPPLTWRQRLEICIGAARGLKYLHDEANPIIIHRDVKSNNILLDENWVAKISDFGLSKMGAPNQPFTHFSTNVKGTFGYMDPEYFSTKKLTRKSDVYAFGVVLFEVLSGRAAVDMQLDDEQHSLATWARYCIRYGGVDKLIDPNLDGQISPPSLRLFVGVAGRCLDTHPPERPPMADIVVSLEMALALQQNPSSARQEDEEEEENINDSTKLL